MRIPGRNSRPGGRGSRRAAGARREPRPPGWSRKSFPGINVGARLRRRAGPDDLVALAGFALAPVAAIRAGGEPGDHDSAAVVAGAGALAAGAALGQLA